MTSGVYAIVNERTGEQYIGASSNIEHRWQVHLSLLRHGKHNSSTLQYAWMHDGEAAFKFIVLELAPLDILASRESAYLAKRLQSRGSNEYNSTGYSDRPAGWVNLHDLPIFDELAGYVSVARASDLLGVNDARVRQMVGHGQLQARRWGGKALMIDKLSVEDALAEQPRHHQKRGPAKGQGGRPRKTTK